jgi:hypothetical protein
MQMHKFTLLFPHYIAWHYTLGLRGIMHHWETFTWFFWHFFAIDLQFKTLFLPFERLQETSKGSGLDLEAIFSAFATTMIMRMVGFLLRLSVIAIGFLSILALAVCAIFVLFLWLIMPLLICVMLVVAIAALFSSPNAVTS